MRARGRRIVQAVLISLVAFMTLGGGAGFALAASDHTKVPDLIVPRPHVGDKAVYRSDWVTLDPKELQESEIPNLMDSLTLEWLPETVLHDELFRAIVVQPLRSTLVWGQGSDRQIFELTSYYDGATGRPISIEVNRTFLQQRSGQTVTLEPLLPPTMVERQVVSQEYGNAPGSCGAFSALNGNPYYTGTNITVAGDCKWPGVPAMNYTGLGWEGGPHNRSYRFQSTDDRDFNLWYSDQVSFPVRWQATLGHNILWPYTYGRQFDLTLVSFSSTGEPYSVPGYPTGGLGPAPMVARPAWGLDETGVDTPFPLEAAYGAALAQASNMGTGSETASEFMARYPDAYVGMAFLDRVSDRNGNEHPNWILVFTDGLHAIGKRIERAPVGALGIYLPEQTGWYDVVSDWSVENAFPKGVRGLFALPDAVPQQAPTALGLAMRYNAVSGVTDLPYPGYGFQLFCQVGDCHAADAHWWGGQVGEDDAGLIVLENFQASTYFEDSVGVNDQGRMVWHTYIQSSRQAHFLVVPGHATPNKGEAVVATSEAAAFVLPGGKAAAGVSFAALLAGLAYYFWPALKGVLGGGLFTRIEGGRILDHPVRKSIHQAIEAEPGIHFQALARKLSLGRGTLEHHLRKLEGADLLVVRRGTGYTCYFPKGAVDRRLMDAAPILRSDGGRAVLDAVAKQPGASSRTLAASLGYAPSTVSYHLKRLETAGLVSQDGGVRLTELGEAAGAA